MMFSKTTGCFYPNNIYYANPPSDLVNVTNEEYLSAMNRNPGETLDIVDGRMVIIAAIAPSIADTAVQMWQKIKAERDRRIQNGGYKASGKWFHSDTFSRTQQMALLMLGDNIPPNVKWKSMDGSFVTMTKALAAQIFTAAVTHDMTIFSVAETHRTNMLSSDNPSDYDFTSGWPESFSPS